MVIVFLFQIVLMSGKFFTRVVMTEPLRTLGSGAWAGFWAACSKEPAHDRYEKPYPARHKRRGTTEP
ncbi:hypothetical protein MES5069_240036 [Mesorhizobium escarrei]|uniref:Uncharacterized protein n=1 Tax=Mesorhizobium escarrei TaxID=666018 RepID=A0ABM9DTP9_9HYPH|nr:hypothetical protein MES5069_240036 [Mesorhizobium escarrei]